MTQTGSQVTAADAGYNPTIGVGGSVTFGSAQLPLPASSRCSRRVVLERSIVAVSQQVKAVRWGRVDARSGPGRRRGTARCFSARLAPCLHRTA
ncbi:hypothetical protein ACFV2X_40725 [Streptomyces sp. NPDC059679]|uniref:hypothetical protein n=1 Tax=Streptomyces sp. NPDC059679 TaxID=3346903 RepID=UPI0036CD77FE